MHLHLARDIDRGDIQIVVEFEKAAAFLGQLGEAAFKSVEFFGAGVRGSLLFRELANMLGEVPKLVGQRTRVLVPRTECDIARHPSQKRADIAR